MNNDTTLPFTGYIELTRGAKTIVDWEDIEWLNQWLWICSSRSYAVRSYRCEEKLGEKRVISMHRAIMERHGHCIEGKEIDHINHDRLCNIKSNLRVATKSQNLINSSRRSNNTSGIAGVYYNKRRDKWEAHLGINSKKLILGVFSNKEDAISARKIGLIKYFGEYANLDENHVLALAAPPIKSTNTEYVPRKRYVSNTGHPGISWQSKASSWVAYIKLDNSRISLGKFNSIELAISVREEALQKVADGTFVEWREQRFQESKAYKPSVNSCPGVSFHKRNGKWEAYVYENKKKKNLGYFLTESEAVAVVSQERTVIAGRDKAIKKTIHNYY